MPLRLKEVFAMEKDRLPVTCPICGRKNEFPVESLFEGSTIVCPLCNLKLRLHGHMWQEIQKDLAKLRTES